MFTTFPQVEDWVRDNGLQHWIFYSTNPKGKEENDRANDKVIDSNYFGSTLEEKLALTEKYLKAYQGRLYGIGWKTEAAKTGGLECQASIENTQPQIQPQPVAQIMGIGEMPFDREQLKSDIRREIEAEIKEKTYTERLKDLEDREREFEKDKSGVMGLLIGYLKPLIPAIAERRVAGVDANHDVVAKIHTEEAAPEQEQEDIFSQEEADEMYELLARFKKVEPDYLKLLRSVVAMAEAQDSTYTMAKGFLIK